MNQVGGIVLGLANMMALGLARVLVPQAWFWTWLPFSIVFSGIYMSWSKRGSTRAGSAA